ncbi:MAG: DUF1854 domain-containing protein [Burkholderiales bacterium]|nr:DUF1854 domain-containing protein [Burkholderiales bacterium]
MKLNLSRNAFGKLVFVGADGAEHVGVTPVRAFPIAAPDKGLSLVSADGHELAWVDRLDDLPLDTRSLIDEELAIREFTPAITRILDVSTFSTPSTWSVSTDRGDTQMVLKSEDDIRRLAEGQLLIASSSGLQYRIADWRHLDRHSKKLLERFL